MQRKKNSPPSSSIPAAKPTPRDLPPDRAFVLHIDARVQLPRRRIAGRVEHVTSGRVAHFASLQELVTFLATVLRRLGEAD
jgi:hypothetical protein